MAGQCCQWTSEKNNMPTLVEEAKARHMRQLQLRNFYYQEKKIHVQKQELDQIQCFHHFTNVYETVLSCRPRMSLESVNADFFFFLFCMIYSCQTLDSSATVINLQDVPHIPRLATVKVKKASFLQTTHCQTYKTNTGKSLLDY